MPDFLFDHSLHIAKRILNSDYIFLFLDYDGTLVPFKDNPTEVVTPEKIKKIIGQLIKNPKILVIIVTGRSLCNIQKLLNLRGLSFIALHGLHIKRLNGSQFNWNPADQTRLLIKEIKEDMEKELHGKEGAFLEDKELTLVLHYRLLPSNRIQIIREKFKKIVSAHDKNRVLEIINGAKIIEVRPKGWNKGTAIEMFLTKYMNKKNILSIYIGDDVTDEDAFQFIGKKGISIYVTNQSKRKTAAQYYVKNPDEVFLFLQSLSQILCPR
jgi:trehalose 6-phosphate phosphatase